MIMSQIRIKMKKIFLAFILALFGLNVSAQLASNNPVKLRRIAIKPVEKATPKPSTIDFSIDQKQADHTLQRL